MKWFKFVFFFSFCFSIVLEGSSQSASFITQDTICLSEKLDIENTSLEGYSYIWDFCQSELENNEGIIKVISDLSDKIAVGFEVINGGDGWYGFISSRDSKSIIRLDYGNTLSSIPIEVDLGNISNSNPGDVRLFYELGNWYGIVANNGNGHLVRLEFGESLSNTPNSVDLGDLGGWGGIYALDLVQDNDSIRVIVASRPNNFISVITLGSSITNTPNMDNVRNYGIGNPLISTPMKLDFEFHNDHWYGLMSNLSNGKIVRIHFNNGMHNSPIFEELVTITQPAGLRFVRDGLNFYGFVVNTSGILYRYDFETSPDKSPSEVILGSFGVLKRTYGLEIEKEWPGWYGFTVGVFDHLLTRISFREECDSPTKPASFEFEPQDIRYSTAGTNSIELIAYNADGFYDTEFKSILVKDATSPLISFSTDNRCITNNNVISGSSNDDQSITKWDWNFGDEKIISGQKITHQFTTAGIHEVTLEVQDINGCGNTLTQTIPIYEKPQSNFILQPGALCSNSEIAFTNQSEIYGADTLIQWHWDFNEEDTSILQDPSYIFDAGGEKDITLVAAIPGCADTAVQTIQVYEGPGTAFGWDATCEYELFEFANQTTGEGITDWLWDFGDGNFTTVQDPKHRYQTGGDYTITLSALNDGGCETVLQQLVNVRYQPAAGYTYELPCSGSEVQFYDASTVEGANISSWGWTLSSFAEASEDKKSLDQNPIFNFEEAGNWEAWLKVASNYGCVDSVMQVLEVLPGPSADFITENNCFNDLTAFMDNTSLPDGITISRYDWLINNQLFTGSTANYRFADYGNHPVTLQVRASNLCESLITKDINIYAAPEATFTTDGECQGAPILFASTAEGINDPIAGYEWQIDEQTISFSPQFTYAFESSGNKDVRLTLITENGCDKTNAETISINPAPAAKFTAAPEVAAPPLEVTFVNQTTGGEQYQWTFEEGATSTEDNPTYTYETIGSKYPTLVASNSYGCYDTATFEIRVLLAEYDLVVTNVQSIPDGDNIRFIIGIRNDGTIIREDFDLRIRVGNAVTLVETVEGRLLPGKSLFHEVSFSLPQLANQDIDFSCFGLALAYDGYDDLTPYNNENCVSFATEMNVLNPYPNPTTDVINVPVVLPENGLVTLQLVDAEGKLVMEKDFQNLPKGLNLIAVDLQAYTQGTYLLTIVNEGRKEVKRVMKE